MVVVALAVLLERFKSIVVLVALAVLTTVVPAAELPIKVTMVKVA